MGFLIWERLPNFAGGDHIDPNKLDHGKIESLLELKGFEFIKFHMEDGYDRYVLVENTYFDGFDYYICVEKKDDLSSRRWIGKLTEERK